ncbi:MAG: methyltransferase [Bacteroides sp.]|nr:methyltransferase [Bacteroides sp.]MCM1413148.1 methyltransferase [Bacteroides sp.]MCM1472110.1 methyltransferase [Bacteroides sp.]
MELVKKNSRAFRFKQFEVRQDFSAMKVGTDGVLLGAWAPADGHRVAWDVGAGTGLISLMLAQRGVGRVCGVEIDHDAAEEMSVNFANSPWADRLHAVEGDILSCYEQLPRPDLIVSNPPFFVNSLPAHGNVRNMARHECCLTCGDLIALAARCLTDDGRLAMVLPIERDDDVQWALAVNRLYPLRRVEVSTVEGKRSRRVLWLVGRDPYGGCVTEHAWIGTGPDGYSAWYRSLTQDFYL